MAWITKLNNSVQGISFIFSIFTKCLVVSGSENSEILFKNVCFGSIFRQLNYIPRKINKNYLDEKHTTWPSLFSPHPCSSAWKRKFSSRIMAPGSGWAQAFAASAPTQSCTNITSLQVHKVCILKQEKVEKIESSGIKEWRSTFREERQVRWLRAGATGLHPYGPELCPDSTLEPLLEPPCPGPVELLADGPLFYAHVPIFSIVYRII